MVRSQGYMVIGGIVESGSGVHEACYYCGKCVYKMFKQRKKVSTLVTQAGIVPPSLGLISRVGVG
jgi:hypothetical protein